MSRSARRVKLLAAFCGLAALTGCAAGADMAKSAGPRTTVPAAVDAAAFTSDGLRSVDVCQLLNEKLLASLGDPEPGELEDYGECTSYMRDKSGKKLTVSVSLDELLVSAPKNSSAKLAGMPTAESASGDSCFQTVVTDVERNLGMTVQVTYPDGDPCVPAKTTLADVVNQIRTHPPRYAPPASSLVTRDPCEDVDDTTASAVLGASVEEKQLWGLRDCGYQAPGVELRVRYTIDSDPKDQQGTSPVDVGGVVAYRDAEKAAEGQCVVEWQRRVLKTNGENVRVTFERDTPTQGEDPCAKAVTAAKAVQAKLGSP